MNLILSVFALTQPLLIACALLHSLRLIDVPTSVLQFGGGMNFGGYDSDAEGGDRSGGADNMGDFSDKAVSSYSAIREIHVLSLGRGCIISY